MHQILHVRRPDIEYFDPAAHLLAQMRPVEIEERMLPRDRPHYVVRDTRPLAKSRQMQLLHFSAAAHVVHQEIRFAFAAYESHNDLLVRPGVTSKEVVVYGPSTTPSMVRCRVASNWLLLLRNSQEGVSSRKQSAFEGFLRFELRPRNISLI